MGRRNTLLLLVVLIAGVLFAGSRLAERLLRLPPQACHERLRAFEEEQNSENVVLLHDGELARLQESVMHLVPRRAPVLDVQSKRVLVDGSAVISIEGAIDDTDVAALFDVFHEKRRNIEQAAAMLGADRPLLLNVVLAADASWGNVARSVEAARQNGFDQIDLWFESERPRPRESAVNRWLVSLLLPSDSQKHGTDRSFQLKMLMVRVVAPRCSATHALAELSSPRTEGSEGPPSLNWMLEDCGCVGDLDLVREFFFRSYVPSQDNPWVRPLVAARARLSDVASSRIAFPASARWRDVGPALVKRLGQGEPTVTFVVEP